MRVLIAAILGAIAMFIWSSIAHLATPLATTGISQIPNEAPVLAAMHSSIGDQSGLYYFPWVDPKDPQMMQKSAAAMKANPSGILIYHPPGGSGGMEGWQLGSEFAKQFVQSLIAAWLLSMAAIASYAMRVAFVSGVGLAAAITTNLSYWIWYGFPLNYTLAYAFVDFAGYVAAGFAIAWWLGRKT
jgi:hypothetical protein